MKLTAALFSFLLLASAAWGRVLSVPMQLDWEFLRRALIEQAYTDPGETARVWDDGTGCNYLVLSDPKVDASAERVRIVTAGKARVGTSVGDQCLVILDWSGFLEVFEEPVLQPEAAAVLFRVVDSNLYDAEWHKPLAVGTVWDLVKKYAHPRLQSVRVDLKGALSDLRELLALVLSSEDVLRLQALLDSVSLAGVTVGTDGLSARIEFAVPEAAASPAAPAPEPTLTAEELQRWEESWQNWDSFLSFVLKQAATDTAAEDLHLELLTVLLDARYELLDALAPSRPGAPDPVRPLFLSTWRRLAPVLRHLSTGLPGEAALRYLSFVNAADALQAIDELGPETGLDISADGLRRLARIVAPASAEDPLRYSVAVDAELRRLFGFGPPLPTPEPDPALDPGAWLWTPAWAAQEFDPKILKRLNQWAPAPDELDAYLPLVRDLLHHSAAVALRNGRLDTAHHRLFHWIVLSTAWQETCWRQFTRSGGHVKAIRSKAGSVGLMQVNQNVWRGFYDLGALQRDIGYNAAAGTEILLRYLVDYALAKGEHTKTGQTANLARATYAVYNAGPGKLTRYRAANVTKRERSVDQAYWEKFQAIRSGDELAVKRCYGR